MKKVLVFAPHPDDEMIGCGASIIKHIQHENEVFLCYIGDTTSVDCATISPEDYKTMRQREIRIVPMRLGIPGKNVFLLDGNPWFYNEAELRMKILNDIIRKVKPNIIYLPHAGEAHPDHAIVSRAAFDAAEMAPSPWFRKFGDKDECPSIETILAYEVWTPIARPNYFEAFDEEVLKKKMEILALYKSQEAEKYIKAYTGMNSYRGAMKEGPLGQYAEAFQVLKVLKLF